MLNKKHSARCNSHVVGDSSMQQTSTIWRTTLGLWIPIQNQLFKIQKVHLAAQCVWIYARLWCSSPSFDHHLVNYCCHGEQKMYVNISLIQFCCPSGWPFLNTVLTWCFSLSLLYGRKTVRRRGGGGGREERKTEGLRWQIAQDCTQLCQLS